MAETASVRVYVRMRPYNSRENDIGLGGEKGFLQFQGTESLQLGGHQHTFDRIYKMTSTQEEIYDTCAKETVDDLMVGYNGTLFAYGQTGAGKSFTMMGPDSDEGPVSSDPTMWGIIPRAVQQIFDYIEAAPQEVTFSLAVSYLEVYREVIRDLLDPSKVNLAVRESPTKGIYVDGATTGFVTCAEDVFQAIAVGDASRAVASTNMNAHSSRSHSLFIMKVTQKNELDGSLKQSQLNLVDLAGSEKIGKTGATGDTLEEAKKINQSLSALANVINALADGKPHIPFRDSKLTRILQQSLGGNCKTALMVACSPHSNNEAETLSSLRFGQRAKTIKTVVKMNEQKSAEELTALVEHLRKELEDLRTYTAALEAALKEAGGELPDRSAVAQAASAAAAQSGSAGGAVPSVPVTGRDAAAFEKLRVEYAALVEQEAFAREELEDLREECSEAQEDREAAEKKVADLQALREKERALAARAVADVKALRQEVAKKNALGMQALQEMKKLQVQLAQRDAQMQSQSASRSELEGQLAQWKKKATNEADEKKRVQVELDEAHTWLKEMQSKVEAVLQLAQQSTEEKTAALLQRQKEIETQLEEARAQITGLRQKESELRAEQAQQEADKEAERAAKAVHDAEIAAKAASEHAAQMEAAEQEAERVRAEMEGVYLKQINDLKTTQEELQTKLADEQQKTAETEKQFQAAQKLAKIRTDSGNHIVDGTVARAAAGIDTHGLSDMQAEVEAQKKQREEAEELLVKQTQVEADRIAKIEQEHEEKLKLLTDELEATKAAAKEEAQQEAEERVKKTQEDSAATIKTLEEANEKMAADLESMANTRVEEVRRQAAVDIEAAKKDAACERVEAQETIDELERQLEETDNTHETAVAELTERLTAKNTAISTDLADLQERAKADKQEAEAAMVRLKESMAAKLADAEQKHSSAMAELEARADERMAKAAADADERVAAIRREHEAERSALASSGGGSADLAAVQQAAAARMQEAERQFTEKLATERADAQQKIESAKQHAQTDAQAAQEALTADHAATVSELEHGKKVAEQRAEAAEAKLAQTRASVEEMSQKDRAAITERCRQEVEKEKAEVERVKTYAQNRLGELEKVAAEKVASAEKVAAERVEAEKEMAKKRFLALQQQAHAQVAEMQRQTNSKIEDFRAQAQKYVMDARNQALQQAERDLKGQFEAKLLEAEQRNTQTVAQNKQLTQQLQTLQEQLRQLTQEQQSGGRSTFGTPSAGISGGGGAISGGQSAFSFMNAAGPPTLGGGGGGLRGGGGRGRGQKPVVLSAFGNASSAPPASPRPAEGTPPGPGGGGSTAGQWASHTRQQMGHQPIYRPQTDVPNTQVRTQVAKQGFLIKSSGGKKDSVSAVPQ